MQDMPRNDMKQTTLLKPIPWPARILHAKIPAVYFFIIILAVCAGTFYITDYYNKQFKKNEESETWKQAQYDIKRLHGLNFIEPLLSAKPLTEYDGYQGIKQSVNNVIQGYIDQGTIAIASVYVRDFDKANWFCINNDTKYNPASILKIVNLMTFLMMEKTQPGVLNKTLTFDTKFATVKDVKISAKNIEFGKTYTVKELLKSMIINSDNDAVNLLFRIMDQKVFLKIFADLGLLVPDLNGPAFPVSVKECSVFLEAIFNASYLSIEDSEYAINLLTQCSFRDGIVKGIGDPSLKIAHKFGEAGDLITKELHETAILYINNKPYLITIMTRGRANIPMTKLEEVLQGISKQIYSGFVSLSNGTI